jgi:hypothetical protein
LLHATQLFEFGNQHRGIGSHDFYGSSGYKDELAWAATWLHKVGVVWDGVVVVVWGGGGMVVVVWGLRVG